MVRRPEATPERPARPGLSALVRRALHRPLPVPPGRLRRGPLRAGAFGSTLRSPRLTSQLGLWLGAAFAICFATGLLSHAVQHPPWWFSWPSRPVNAYRITQGLHVATGLALVPLLGAKLWAVYPRLFAWPPARDPAHALERASVAVLVSTALFEVVSGVLNVAHLYRAMPFFFPSAHHWTAWLAFGSLLLHVAVQLPVVRESLARRPAGGSAGESAGGMSRRGLLGAVGAAAAAITLATAGQTLRPLATVSVLAPRRPERGPQGLAVNATAAGAGVTGAALDPGYRLLVTGPAGTVRLSLAELTGFPQHTAVLPIACVEGWSADAVWTGVRVRDLLSLVGVPDGAAEVHVESLQRGGRYRASTLAAPHVRDPLTLLALRLRGETLHLDHGYPCRLIAPNRPGVMQTKWVAALTVVAR